MASNTLFPTATRHSVMLLHRLDRIARRRKETALEPVDLRPRQVVALMILRDHGAMTQGALGETLNLDPANVVGLLNELEERELLDRRRDPEDRRRHIVELTPAGKKALAHAERAMEDLEEEILGALAPDERAQLRDLLDRALSGNPAEQPA
jgi:DNA-binding MarR family transcriptional regulator